MKKTYIYFLCLSAINFIICMELQRPKLFTADYDNATTNIYSHHDIHPPIFSIPLQVNEPGWQQLHAIANMTYNSPVYRPIEPLRYAISQQELQQEEKRTLLKTNVAIQQNNN